MTFDIYIYDSRCVLSIVLNGQNNYRLKHIFAW